MLWCNMIHAASYIYDLERCHTSYQGIPYYLSDGTGVWSPVYRQSCIYLKLQDMQSKHMIKETLPMSCRKCHEFLSQHILGRPKDRLAVSSITPHWPARTSGAACGVHPRKAGSMSVEGTLTGSWPSWRFSPFAYNGPMFAWIFWLWSECKKSSW